MGDNEPRFAIVCGVNAVYGDWNPCLELPSHIAATELSIVVGPILGWPEIRARARPIVLRGNRQWDASSPDRPGLRERCAARADRHGDGSRLS